MVYSIPGGMAGQLVHAGTDGGGGRTALAPGDSAIEAPEGLPFSRVEG
jgi:hypothetical protein